VIRSNATGRAYDREAPGTRELGETYTVLDDAAEFGARAH